MGGALKQEPPGETNFDKTGTYFSEQRYQG